MNEEKTISPEVAFTIISTLREQIEIQKMRIRKLKQQKQQREELLKECELWFTGIVGNMNDKNVGEHNRNLPIGNFEYVFKVFSQKINEALK